MCVCWEVTMLMYTYPYALYAATAAASLIVFANVSVNPALVVVVAAG
jgi:hypothetical protein